VFEGSGDQRFRGDDGSADPAAAAALSAFAAAEGSEHAVLTALAGTRLLVPVVAALSEPAQQAARRATPVPGASAADASAVDDSTASVSPGTAGPATLVAAAGEKASEMALPTLVGKDGRPAIPVFTGLDALARWQPSARPIPVDAALVWRAAVQDSCAVVIDVAGPVPLAVEGARLAALASGAPVPLPHEDPDVRDLVAAAVTAAGAGLGLDAGCCTLSPAAQGSDLLLELRLPASLDRAAADEFVARLGSAVLAGLGARLRRGIAIAAVARQSATNE
jgi:hypothetical protein